MKDQIVLIITIIISCILSVQAICPSECNYCLTQEFFNDGTFRITESGLYCLDEDIIFNPRPGNVINPNAAGSWFPIDSVNYPGCSQQIGSYALGFFAVITIEANNVQLNLRGYTIEYSEYFYLQQRFGVHIEIGSKPFLPGFGPADWGQNFVQVTDVKIYNGQLGLTSHHAIHSNNAKNLIIEDVNMSDFEVAAIQLNGFNNIELNNINIGPSLQDVPLNGFYSNSRFILLALRQLLAAIETNNLEMPQITFAYSSNPLTLQQIHNNLVIAMDLVFRDVIGQTLSSSQKNDPLYKKGINLYRNNKKLPDGSAIYGILLNSHGTAVDGFGDSLDGPDRGENVKMNNVNIDNLKLVVDEIPVLYFDQCDNSESVSIQTGPFGDILDIRKMIEEENIYYIDNYPLIDIFTLMQNLQYIGNPLSDAQIALYLLRNYVNDGKNYAFGSFMSDYFLEWALGQRLWPVCGDFVCNGDVMFHTNKGVMGARIDQIENVEINNLHITNLENNSPLGTFACSSYVGPNDGGIGGTRPFQGAMNTDIRGISITGGDVIINGDKNMIQNLESQYGDTTAIDLMNAAKLEFVDDCTMIIEEIAGATEVNDELYEDLLSMNKTPYPNNFNLCTVNIQDGSMLINPPNNIPQQTDCTAIYGTITHSKGSGQADDEGANSNNSNEQTKEIINKMYIGIGCAIFVLLLISVVFILFYYYKKSKMLKSELNQAMYGSVVDEQSRL